MTKEEAYNQATHQSIANNPNGTRMDVIYLAMEIYASRQPFQQLISWMEEEREGYEKGWENEAVPMKSSLYLHRSNMLALCIAKAKELAAAPQDESGVKKDDWVSVEDGLPDFDEQVIFRAKIDWKKGDDSVVYFVDKLTRQEETLEYGHWAYLLAVHTDFLVSQNHLIKEVCQEYVTHWKPLKPLPPHQRKLER